MSRERKYNQIDATVVQQNNVDLDTIISTEISLAISTEVELRDEAIELAVSTAIELHVSAAHI